MRNTTLLQTPTSWSHPAESGTMSGGYDEYASQEEATDSFWEVSKNRAAEFDRLNLSSEWHCIVMNCRQTSLLWVGEKKYDALSRLSALCRVTTVHKSGMCSTVNIASDLSWVLRHGSKNCSHLLSWYSHTDCQQSDKLSHLEAII